MLPLLRVGKEECLQSFASAGFWKSPPTMFLFKSRISLWIVSREALSSVIVTLYLKNVCNDPLSASVPKTYWIPRVDKGPTVLHCAGHNTCCRVTIHLYSHKTLVTIQSHWPGEGDRLGQSQATLYIWIPGATLFQLFGINAVKPSYLLTEQDCIWSRFAWFVLVNWVYYLKQRITVIVLILSWFSSLSFVSIVLFASIVMTIIW